MTTHLKNILIKWKHGGNLSFKKTYIINLFHICQRSWIPFYLGPEAHSGVMTSMGQSGQISMLILWSVFWTSSTQFCFCLQTLLGHLVSICHHHWTSFFGKQVCISVVSFVDCQLIGCLSHSSQQSECLEQVLNQNTSFIISLSFRWTEWFLYFPILTNSKTWEMSASAWWGIFFITN